MDRVESKFLQTQKFQPLVWISYIERKYQLPRSQCQTSYDKLQTSLYLKPTDHHQNLYFQSSHPKHTKISIVYGQILRFSMICSQEKDYQNYCNQMKSWFLKRSYPEHSIDFEMKRDKFKSREKA